MDILIPLTSDGRKIKSRDNNFVCPFCDGQSFKILFQKYWAVYDCDDCNYIVNIRYQTDEGKLVLWI